LQQLCIHSAAQKLRLLNELRARIRAKYYSYWTEESYTQASALGRDATVGFPETGRSDDLPMSASRRYELPQSN
jgi:hypothetical protein